MSLIPIRPFFPVSNFRSFHRRNSKSLNVYRGYATPAYTVSIGLQFLFTRARPYHFRAIARGIHFSSMSIKAQAVFAWLSLSAEPESHRSLDTGGHMRRS
jgi:hypothetical protein